MSKELLKLLKKRIEEEQQQCHYIPKGRVFIRDHTEASTVDASPVQPTGFRNSSSEDTFATVSKQIGVKLPEPDNNVRVPF